MPKFNHRIDRFTDAHGYAYCGVCHRGLFRRAFFAHPQLGRSAAKPLAQLGRSAAEPLAELGRSAAELDPEGPGTLIQIERHVGEPYRPETWAGLVANGLRHTPARRP